MGRVQVSIPGCIPGLLDHPRVLAFALRPETPPLHQDCMHRLKRIHFTLPVSRARCHSIEQLDAKDPLGVPLLQLAMGQCVRVACVEKAGASIYFLQRTSRAINGSNYCQLPLEAINRCYVGNETEDNVFV